MRVVIQRVRSAKVVVDGHKVGSIEKGLLILAGFTHEDNSEDIEWMCRKLAYLRVFSDAEAKMNLSIKDADGEFLVVSQFTLLASTKKGNRPSYIRAAEPQKAKQYYQLFVEELTKYGQPVKEGRFGAMMDVSLVNDGPVTIYMDSKKRE